MISPSEDIHFASIHNLPTKEGDHIVLSLIKITPVLKQIWWGAISIREWGKAIVSSKVSGGETGHLGTSGVQLDWVELEPWCPVSFINTCQPAPPGREDDNVKWMT